MDGQVGSEKTYEGGRGEELEVAVRYAAELLAEHRERLFGMIRYAERYGAPVGSSVTKFVLQDALAYRGTTLEEFYKSEDKVSNKQTPD